MINITDKILIVPRGVPGLSPLQIDLSQVYKTETRIPEVAFVTPQKAPELLTTFIEAYQILHKYLVAVDFERSQAQRAADKVRAHILLDKLPLILKERGLVSSRSPLGSEDIRGAILALDTEYIEALDKIDALSAAVELIKGKAKSIEMAYTSVKKIIGEGVYNYRNTNLTGPAERPESNPDNNEESPETLGHELPANVRGSFGSPRY